MAGDQIADVKRILKEYEGKYRYSVRNWKLGYRVLLIISLLSTLLAAAIAKFDIKLGIPKDDLAAGLGFFATILTGLIASLRFEANFRINRKSRHEVAIIMLESEKSNADPDALLVMLQDVVKRRSDELTK